jgi:uncharacterized BrkB/YihY/UPF0761 family membrane protein
MNKEHMGYTTYVKSMLNDDDKTHRLVLNETQEIITSLNMVVLLCDIAVCSVNNIQLSRIIIDWLKSLCDDNYENNKMLMEYIGIYVCICVCMWMFICIYILSL